MRDTQREPETQAEGEAGSLQGAQCGTRSQDPRMTPWAKADIPLLSHPGAPRSLSSTPSLPLQPCRKQSHYWLCKEEVKRHPKEQKQRGGRGVPLEKLWSSL